jgi:hypothetical protein
MSQHITELIGLRERIERRLIGALHGRHRVNAVMVIGAEFNQLLVTKATAPVLDAIEDGARLPRPFQLIRLVDHSGVSGTGVVAEGVQFTTGRAALHWVSNEPSTTAWDSVEAMLRVHGHGGDTVLRWVGESTVLPS